MAPDLRSDQRGREDHEACPVCFDELPRTKMAHFPCGHAVCTRCDRSLRQREFLFCPTCRTPREGVSAEQVELSNQRRVQDDTQNENGIQVTAAQRNVQYRILFFPDESHGTPLVFSRALRPLRNVRIRRSVPPHHRRESRDRSRDRGDGEGEGEEQEGEGGQNVNAPVLLDSAIASLVDGLMTPVSVDEFLARRRRV